MEGVWHSAGPIMGLRIIMIGKKTIFLVMCFSCLVTSHLRSHEKDPKPRSAVLPQQGILSFDFQINVHQLKKLIGDKTKTIIEGELGKFGNFKKLEVYKDGCIDPSAFTKYGATLYFDIEEIKSIDGKNLPVLQATLTMYTPTIIKKTQKESYTPIWSQSCFIEGSLEFDSSSKVTKSLDKLLSQFMESYSLVNSEKPTFYLDETYM